jgi:type II secretory pathway pseudopilin PulG
MPLQSPKIFSITRAHNASIKAPARPNPQSPIPNPRSFSFQLSAFSNTFRPAFTLVEVLIAIAIALLLIIGISQIFAIAQRTVSMGTAFLGATAQNRSIQTTFNRDFHAMIPISDNPALIVASYAAGAFRNKPDSDQAPDQTNPLNFGANFTNIALQQAFSPNYRVHRVDRFGFFARDSFRSQMADSPSLSSSITSNEAYVWYGHLALPNNPAISKWMATDPGGTTLATGAAWMNPGVPNGTSGPLNDNNQFASSWVLGRQVLLLVPLSSATIPQSGFVPASPPASPSRYPLPFQLDPVSGLMATVVDLEHSNTVASLYASRYDVCYTTVATWKSRISSLATLPLSPRWWEQLSGLQTDNSGLGVIRVDQRFLANPYPTKPDPSAAPLSPPETWNSAAAAQTAPIFIRGCTQFIVEFAGDFATQNPATGAFVPPAVPGQIVPDGQIDYIIDPLTGEHRIRWYGFPRDTGSSTGDSKPDGTVDLFDVIPVSWFLNTPVAFERAVPTSNLGSTSMAMAPATSSLPMLSSAYVCAWGSDGTSALKPKLMRITVAVDDANGRLNTEQTYEYVFPIQ